MKQTKMLLCLLLITVMLMTFFSACAEDLGEIKSDNSAETSDEQAGKTTDPESEGKTTAPEKTEPGTTEPEGTEPNATEPEAGNDTTPEEPPVTEEPTTAEPETTAPEDESNTPAATAEAYLAYYEMSADEQMEFINSFPSMDDFFAWHTAAKEAYESERAPIDGGITLS